MLDATIYFDLKTAVLAAGFADEISWAEDIKPCESATDFALEHAFVVCNSGMKAQIAVVIYRKVKDALLSNRPVASVFGHKGKASAIEHVFANRHRLFEEFNAATDKLTFLERLPWIGGITKYHLAKNFGVPCCKPDRHLVRIARDNGTTPELLCERLAQETGNNVPTVDTVLWRAANQGMI
jgi:hypothetical protein